MLPPSKKTFTDDKSLVCGKMMTNLNTVSAVDLPSHGARVQIMDIHKRDSDGSATSSSRKHGLGQGLSQKFFVTASLGKCVRPVSALNYLMKGLVMEREKKTGALGAGGSVWNKTEYALAKNGFLFRTRVGSGKELASFDLRHTDVDKKRLLMGQPEDGLTPLTIRFVKYTLSGEEKIWFARHESPEVMQNWFDEMQAWKADWYREDWKQNLFVQIPRVPVEPGSLWDLAHIVAEERHLGGNSPNGQASTVLFDQDFNDDLEGDQ